MLLTLDGCVLTGQSQLLSFTESALSSRSCLVHLEGEPEMTELEILSRDIQGLKELLRVAWREAANPVLTPFERHETRNLINQYSGELRGHLQRLKDELSRPRIQTSDVPPFREAKFRILA
jgi:hypothetical protein